jgi:hypothetical protein
MSDTIYTYEEIEILQAKIINDIFNICLERNKKIDNQTDKIKFTEDDKLFLIENLKKYKIIACKIIFKIEYESFKDFYDQNLSTYHKENIYIHYINIHGDVYANNIITRIGQYYKVGILDFIDYPFYIYQEYEDYRSQNSLRTELIAKQKLQRRITYDKYNYIYGTINYIEKSFILPKYLLNLIFESNYIDYIDICSTLNYHLQTDLHKKKKIKDLNYTNNIYIKFMKYIINKNDAKFNSLFYCNDDIEKIDDIEILHKKEIDEYYDNIEKEKEILRLEELDRIAKEKQDELDRIAKEKQEELDRIAKEKQEELDKENEIKRIARGIITIKKNTLIIDKNTYENVNLCDFLPYKTKKICDDSGSIKNIRYTEITNITFINCKLSEISKYYTGITHLTFIKCNNFKTMSRYLKAELKYLKINNEILFDKTDVYGV